MYSTGRNLCWFCITAFSVSAWSNAGGEYSVEASADVSSAKSTSSILELCPKEAEQPEQEAGLDSSATTPDKFRMSESILCNEAPLKSELKFTSEQRTSTYLNQYRNKDLNDKSDRSDTGQQPLCGEKTHVGCTGPVVQLTIDDQIENQLGSMDVTYLDVIRYYAQRYDIDPYLLFAISRVESGHNSNTVSPKGAIGLMQIMPATAIALGHQGNAKELYDPDTNVRLACIYLRTLYRDYGNDIPLILAAYNAGQGAVQRYGRNIPPYPETQDYVRRVMSYYMELRTL